ncbi:hypothetical protein B566_EDAN017323 [Ephemera danica]|nr:hypothetical protein B566_EDAN017323 [Ephemera danica]
MLTVFIFYCFRISHFTYHERTDCYVFVYDVGCEVTKLSEFVKTATLEDRKCLVEQVIKLVQHFHTHRILYGHLQPDLMYVALSENDRKPQLKTMLEDLKDAAHVIAFIYNQGDTARTTDIANNVMEELQSQCYLKYGVTG